MGSRLLRIYFCIFLTLVGVTLSAKPHSDSPEAKVESEPVMGETDALVLDNLSASPNPLGNSRLDEFVRTFNKDDYYHAYRQSIFAYVGAVMGSIDSQDSVGLINYMFGFTWELPKALSPKYEVGAAWATMNAGQMSFSRKIIYNEKGAIRPFYKYGLILKIEPDDQAANLTDTENFLIRAGVGLEDIKKPPKSVRVDLDLAIGKNDLWVMFQYGYSWGW